jgi:hypothetical protein
MATEKTPTHKRIKRAEAGRDDWKMKALDRREEITKLRNEIASKEKLLAECLRRNCELANTLLASNKKISEQDRLIENLKKKR